MTPTVRRAWSSACWAPTGAALLGLRGWSLGVPPGVEPFRGCAAALSAGSSAAGATGAVLDLDVVRNAGAGGESSTSWTSAGTSKGGESGTLDTECKDTF